MLKRARAGPNMQERSPRPSFARTPAKKLKHFDRLFEAEMDKILIQPDWFKKWKENFKEEIPKGAQFEEMVGQTMDKMRGRVAPATDWTVALCAGKRLQECEAEADEVLGAVRGGIPCFNCQAHHVGRLRHLHQHINGGPNYPEGLALWAGHDYSSTKGRKISHWADEYRG
jgi:hypothetical protein